MPTIVKMPVLGESVTEGTVLRWLKAEGDRVEVEEALLEVSTDKVDTEVPSPVAGIVLEIRVAEDETVGIGADLAVIGEAGTETPRGGAAPDPGKAAPVVTAVAAAPAAAVSRVEPVPSAPDRHLTLLVRRLAQERGVDLSTLVGTGAGGRIRKADVLAAVGAASAPASPTPPAPQALRPISAGERGLVPAVGAVAGAVPVDTPTPAVVVMEADLTQAVRLRGAEVLPLVAAAVVGALKAHPLVNSSLAAGAGAPSPAQHLALGVETGRGRVLPVVRDAGDLGLDGLTRRIADVQERARRDALAPDELEGGTFTLTCAASDGILLSTPAVQRPNIAALALGTVAERPVVVSVPGGDRAVAIRSMAYLTLSYDVRLLTEMDATRFLVTVRERLEAVVLDA